MGGNRAIFATLLVVLVSLCLEANGASTNGATTANLENLCVGATDMMAPIMASEDNGAIMNLDWLEINYENEDSEFDTRGVLSLKSDTLIKFLGRWDFRGNNEFQKPMDIAGDLTIAGNLVFDYLNLAEIRTRLIKFDTRLSVEDINVNGTASINRVESNTIVIGGDDSSPCLNVTNTLEAGDQLLSGSSTLGSMTVNQQITVAGDAGATSAAISPFTAGDGEADSITVSGLTTVSGSLMGSGGADFGSLEASDSVFGEANFAHVLVTGLVGPYSQIYTVDMVVDLMIVTDADFIGGFLDSNTVLSEGNGSMNRVENEEGYLRVQSDTGNTAVANFDTINVAGPIMQDRSSSQTAALGPTTVTGTLTVNGPTSVGGDVSVDGLTHFADTFTTGNLCIFGDATICTDLEVNNDVTQTAGQTTVQGTLSVGANVNSDSTFGGDVTVTGNTDITGNLNVVDADANSVISGDAAFTGDVSTSHILDITGNLTVGGTFTDLSTTDNGVRVYGNAEFTGSATFTGEDTKISVEDARTLIGGTTTYNANLRLISDETEPTNSQIVVDNDTDQNEIPRLTVIDLNVNGPFVSTGTFSVSGDEGVFMVQESTSITCTTSPTTPCSTEFDGPVEIGGGNFDILSVSNFQNRVTTEKTLTITTPTVGQISSPLANSTQQTGTTVTIEDTILSTEFIGDDANVNDLAVSAFAVLTEIDVAGPVDGPGANTLNINGDVQVLPGSTWYSNVGNFREYVIVDQAGNGTFILNEGSVSNPGSVTVQTFSSNGTVEVMGNILANVGTSQINAITELRVMDATVSGATVFDEALTVRRNVLGTTSNLHSADGFIAQDMVATSGELPNVNLKATSPKVLPGTTGLPATASIENLMVTGETILGDTKIDNTVHMLVQVETEFYTPVYFAAGVETDSSSVQLGVSGSSAGSDIAIEVFVDVYESGTPATSVIQGGIAFETKFSWFGNLQVLSDALDATTTDTFNIAQSPRLVGGHHFVIGFDGTDAWNSGYLHVVDSSASGTSQTSWLVGHTGTTQGDIRTDIHGGLRVQRDDDGRIFGTGLADAWVTDHSTSTTTTTFNSNKLTMATIFNVGSDREAISIQTFEGDVCDGDSRDGGRDFCKVSLTDFVERSTNTNEDAIISSAIFWVGGPTVISQGFQAGELCADSTSSPDRCEAARFLFEGCWRPSSSGLCDVSWIKVSQDDAGAAPAINPQSFVESVEIQFTGALHLFSISNHIDRREVSLPTSLFHSQDISPHMEDTAFYYFPAISLNRDTTAIGLNHANILRMASSEFRINIQPWGRRSNDFSALNQQRLAGKVFTVFGYELPSEVTSTSVGRQTNPKGAHTITSVRFPGLLRDRANYTDVGSVFTILDGNEADFTGALYDGMVLTRSEECFVINAGGPTSHSVGNRQVTDTVRGVSGPNDLPGRCAQTLVVDSGVLNGNHVDMRSRNDYSGGLLDYRSGDAYKDGRLACTAVHDPSATVTGVFPGSCLDLTTDVTAVTANEASMTSDDTPSGWGTNDELQGDMWQTGCRAEGLPGSPGAVTWQKAYGSVPDVWAVTFMFFDHDQSRVIGGREGDSAGNFLDQENYDLADGASGLELAIINYSVEAIYDPARGTDEVVTDAPAPADITRVGSTGGLSAACKASFDTA